MTVVFLAREGIAADYITSVLEKSFAIRVLLEKGGPARYRKLKRYFRPADVLRWPLRALDVAAVAIYNGQIDRALKSALLPKIAAHNRRTSEVRSCADANDPVARQVLQSWKPDLVLVYGTALLNLKTISLSGGLFLNLHGGIVPSYRNVHCEFQALARRDTAALGVSVLYLTAGVDDGDVALQRHLQLDDTTTVRAAITANTVLAAELAVEAVELFRQAQLPRMAQAQLGSVTIKTQTPSAWDLAKAWFQKRI